MGQTYFSSAGAIQTGLTSTVQGLGTVGYVSTQSLTSTVAGLGQTYFSSAGAIQTGLTSTVQGLGTVGYVSTQSLTSTVASLQTGQVGSTISISSITAFTSNLNPVNVNTYLLATQPNTSNIWVAGGADAGSASVKYSLDGITWSNTTGVSKYVTWAMAFNGNFFLLNANDAGGGGNVIYRSTDGVNWSAVTTSGTRPGNGTVGSLMWSGSFWFLTGEVSGGTSNTSICRSPDGVIWTAATSGGFSGNCRNIAYNGRRLVAVGFSGDTNTIRYSDDHGLNWTNGTNGFDDTGNGVATDGKIWVAIGADTLSNATIKYSFNGISWSNIVTNGFTAYGLRVRTNGKVFVAGGANSSATSSNYIKYSYDGITWSDAVGLSSNALVIDLQWNGTIWVAGTSHATNKIVYSADGINWSNATGSFPSVEVASIAFSSNVFPNFQAENLAVFGKSQFPLNVSTNTIHMDLSTMVFDNTLRVGWDSRVGINCNLPVYSLDVNGNFEVQSSNANGTYQFRNLQDATLNRIEYIGPAGAYFDLGAGATDADFRISYTSTNRYVQLGGSSRASTFYLSPGNATGRVGINFAEPATRLVLSVEDQSARTGLAVNSANVYTVIGATSNLAANAGSIQVTSGGSGSAIGTTPYALWLQPRGGNTIIGYSTQTIVMGYSSTSVGINNSSPPTALSVVAPTSNARSGIAVNYGDVNMVLGTGGANGANAGSIQVTSGGSATTIGTTPYKLWLQPNGGETLFGYSSQTQIITMGLSSTLVGINTTSGASYPLDVNGTTRILGNLQIGQSNVTTTGTAASPSPTMLIQFPGDGNSYIRNMSTSGSLYLGASNANYVEITSNGGFITTNTTTSGQYFFGVSNDSVFNNIEFGGPRGAYIDFKAGPTTVNDRDLRISYFSTNTYVEMITSDRASSIVLRPANGNTTNGRVGILTTTPAYTLDVNGTTQASVTRGGQHLYVSGRPNSNYFTEQGAYMSWNNSGGDGSTYFVNNIGGGTTGGFRFRNAASDGSFSNDPLTITGNGRVGINCNSPLYAIDFNLISTAGARMNFNGTSPDDYLYLTNNFSTISQMRIIPRTTAAGNWNSLTQLNDSAIIYGAGNTSSTGFVLGPWSGGTRINMGLRMDSNGLVGIGLSNPSYTLDVNGSVRGTDLLMNTNALSIKWAIPLGYLIDGTATTAGNYLDPLLMTNSSNAAAFKVLTKVDSEDFIYLAPRTQVILFYDNGSGTSNVYSNASFSNWSISATAAINQVNSYTAVYI